MTPAAAAPLSAQPFSGYATGTQVSTDALTTGTTQVANVQQAFAGATVNSQGLGTGIDNEMSQVVQPPLPSKNSYGRGAGAEIGLVTDTASPVDPNQFVLSGLAEAAAPPSQGPVVETVGPIDLPPVLFASLLQGTAQATYDPNFCPIGKPLSYGKGEAANVQVLPTDAGGPGGLVNTGVGSETNTANSRSFEYFAPNGDGTFGLVSETHQHLVPIGIGAPVAGITPLTVQVDGDFVMRVTASGKPGRPAFKFIGDPGPAASIEFSDPLVTITGPLGVPVLGPLNLSALLALPPISVPGIATVTVDGIPRAIGGLPTDPAAISPDGTSVAAAYDLLRIALLDLPGLGGLNLRVGHMEGAATVPAGGVKCDIPVSKTGTPDPAQAGQDVTLTISIPDDPAHFSELFDCDLINISATDTSRVLEGNPRFTVTGASNGGVIDGDTVTWANLGNYTRGSPPIKVTITVHIIGGTGVMEDVANVSATLGNCSGGIAGEDITGSGLLDGGAVLGSVTFGGPRIGAGNLAATGENGKYLLLGGAMLFGAVAVMGVRRRLRTQAASSESS
jgi:hypothetical protein